MSKLSPEQARQMIQRIASQSKVKVERPSSGGAVSGTPGFGVRQQSQSAAVKPPDTSQPPSTMSTTSVGRPAQEGVRAVRSQAQGAQPGFGVRRADSQPRSTTTGVGSGGTSPVPASGQPSQRSQQRSWLEQGADILKDVGAAVIEGAVEALAGTDSTVTDSVETESNDVSDGGVTQQGDDSFMTESSESITVVPGFKFARIVSRRKGV